MEGSSPSGRKTEFVDRRAKAWGAPMSETLSPCDPLANANAYSSSRQHRLRKNNADRYVGETLRLGTTLRECGV